MNQSPKNNNITIEGARLLFRNFAGREGDYNPKGRRNFCVILDPDLARILEKDGWNIRWTKPRDDYDDPAPYMQVAVAFDLWPPTVVMITSRGKTKLDEESVSELDYADIETVDLIIRGSNWKRPDGTKGIKGYLKSLYATLVKDELEEKYHNTPENAVAPPGDHQCPGCQQCDGTGECGRRNGDDGLPF